MDSAEYLQKLDKDATTGFLHLLVLLHVHKLQPVHGYALIRAMDDATGSKGLWKDGTIYPLLSTLEAGGIIASRWGQPTAGPRRRYYEMTPVGRQVLRVAIQQWRELRNTMDTILEGGKL